MLIKNDYDYDNDNCEITANNIQSDVFLFLMSHVQVTASVSGISELTNVVTTSLPYKSEKIVYHCDCLSDQSVYTNSSFYKANNEFDSTTKGDKDRAELDLSSPTLSNSVNHTENLFNVQDVLRRNKTRRIGRMDFFLRDEPLPKKTMENPALVVIGCSRLNSIVRVLEEIAIIPGINDYSLYLSLGCIETITATVLSCFINHFLESPFPP